MRLVETCLAIQKRLITVVFLAASTVVGLFLVGCEKEFTYEPIPEPLRIVLYSFLEEDSIFKVNIRQSAPITSNDSRSITQEGTLSVYADSILVLSKQCGGDTSWIELPSLKVRSEVKYRLEFESVELVLTHAQTTVPKPLATMKVDTISAVSLSVEQRDTLMVCKIAFKDSIDLANFYQLSIYSITQAAIDSPTVIKEIDFLKTDKVFLSTIQSTGLWKGIDFQGLFTDAEIDGMNYVISIALPKSYFINDDLLVRKSVSFGIYSLSSEYFEYYRSRKIAEGYLGVPFLDPVQVYSNVENGLGCVGGISSRWVHFEAIIP